MGTRQLPGGVLRGSKGTAGVLSCRNLDPPDHTAHSLTLLTGVGAVCDSTKGDIWAVGVVLLMLCGSAPPWATTVPTRTADQFGAILRVT